MQTPTPVSPSLLERLGNPAEYPDIWIGLIGLVVAVLALIAPFIIEIIKDRIEKRRQKALAKQVDNVSYPEQVIENATRYYVRPLCSNIDPAVEAEIRNTIVTSEDLFSYIDRFLNNSPVNGQQSSSGIKHLILLADSGMGKTSFVLNYFAYNLKKRLDDQLRVAIVHLGTPDAMEKITAIEKKH